jgi:hypothetical protein
VNNAERRAARRKIAEVLRREDAQARRFLRVILSAAGDQGAEKNFIMSLALESDIYWRNVLRAKRQMDVVSRLTYRRGRRGWLSTWYLPQGPPAQ